MPQLTGRICVGASFPMCHLVEIPKSSAEGIITACDGIALGFHVPPVPPLCLPVLVHDSLLFSGVFPPSEMSCMNVCALIAGINGGVFNSTWPSTWPRYTFICTAWRECGRFDLLQTFSKLSIISVTTNNVEVLSLMLSYVCREQMASGFVCLCAFFEGLF